MRILILDSYYSAFLDSFYGRRPEMTQCSYEEQWRALMNEFFGTADFYSTNLIALGHESTEIVANCEPLQRRWANEQGINLDRPKLFWSRRARVIPWPQRLPPPPWFYSLLSAQVRRYRPDLLTGQIACPIADHADFREYDLVLSSFPHFVEQFRHDGLRSEYFNLGFEPRLLDRLQAGPQHRVVFIGGLSVDHAERTRFLEHVAESQPIDIWGYGFDSLSEDSILRPRHHGELWAVDMYNGLFNAKVALNHHINAAGPNANNMRLYEASGVGSFLLTDYKDNLGSLFEPGKEVVAYRSSAEAIELIDYYLTHEDERKAIASAGQARTLREHTYRHRMEEFVDIVRERL
jgi:hypothetical protein